MLLDKDLIDKYHTHIKNKIQYTFVKCIVFFTHNNSKSNKKEGYQILLYGAICTLFYNYPSYKSMVHF